MTDSVSITAQVPLDLAIENNASEWKQISFKEFRSDLSEGIDPSKFPDEEFDLFSIPNFPLRAPEVVKGANIGSNKKSVSPDTVLFSKINPRINRVWRVPANRGRRQIASTEWLQVAPVPGIDPEFLRLFLTRNEVRDFAASRVSGVGGSLMRIRPNVLDELVLPLPPLDEQKEIVAAIETQFARLDDAVAALERARSRLKRYRASVLKAACEGRLVPIEAELARQENRPYEPASEILARIKAARPAQNGPGRAGRLWGAGTVPTLSQKDIASIPLGWSWVKVGDLGNSDETVQVGPMSMKSSEFNPTGVPVMNVGTVQWDRFDESKANFLPEHLAESFDRYRLQPGDVLFTRSGDAPWLDHINVNGS